MNDTSIYIGHIGRRLNHTPAETTTTKLKIYALIIMIMMIIIVTFTTKLGFEHKYFSARCITLMIFVRHSGCVEIGSEYVCVNALGNQPNSIREISTSK